MSEQTKCTDDFLEQNSLPNTIAILNLDLKHCFVCASATLRIIRFEWHHASESCRYSNERLHAPDWQWSSGTLIAPLIAFNRTLTEPAKKINNRTAAQLRPIIKCTGGEMNLWDSCVRLVHPKPCHQCQLCFTALNGSGRVDLHCKWPVIEHLSLVLLPVHSPRRSHVKCLSVKFWFIAD